MCVKNTRNLMHLLVERHYRFRTRSNHNGTITHKIGTSAPSLLRCMKDGIEPSNPIELNVRKSLIYHINMNQSLCFLFHYLCQGTGFLEDCYFMPEGHKKCRCFISKQWLNSIFSWKLKLNLLALIIRNFSML